MREKAKLAVFAVVIGVPLAFHLLFRTCSRLGCRRSILGEALVDQGGVLAEIVRSTEHLFGAVVFLLLAFALLSDVAGRIDS